MTSKLRRLALQYFRDLVSRERYVILMMLLLSAVTSGKLKLIVTLAASASLVIWTILWVLEKIFEEDQDSSSRL
jgi:hypothetical protein